MLGWDLCAVLTDYKSIPWSESFYDVLLQLLHKTYKVKMGETEM